MYKRSQFYNVFIDVISRGSFIKIEERIKQISYDINHLASNPFYYGVPLKSGIACYNHDHEMKFKIKTESVDIVDFIFSPLNYQIFAAGVGANIQIFNLPYDDSEKEITSSVVLKGHSHRTGILKFHPNCGDILASTSLDKSIKIWNVNTQKAGIDFSNINDSPLHIDFSSRGDLLAASCRDKHLRVFDLREKKCVVEKKVYPTPQGFRVLFSKDDQLITSGVSMGNREVSLFDMRNIEKPISNQDLGSISGTVMTFYDKDLGMLYCCGKGVGIIKYYHIEYDKFNRCAMNFNSSNPANGMTLLPKISVNTNKQEIAKFYKLCDQHIIPLSVVVPKRNSEGIFHKEIYPETRTTESTLTAEDFFKGKLNSNKPRRLSLDPKNFDINKLKEVLKKKKQMEFTSDSPEMETYKVFQKSKPKPPRKSSVTKRTQKSTIESSKVPIKRQSVNENKKKNKKKLKIRKSSSLTKKDTEVIKNLQKIIRSEKLLIENFQKKLKEREKTISELKKQLQKSMSNEKNLRNIVSNLKSEIKKLRKAPPAIQTTSPVSIPTSPQFNIEDIKDEINEKITEKINEKIIEIKDDIAEEIRKKLFNHLKKELTNSKKNILKIVQEKLVEAKNDEKVLINGINKKNDDLRIKIDNLAKKNNTKFGELENELKKKSTKNLESTLKNNFNSQIKDIKKSIKDISKKKKPTLSKKDMTSYVTKENNKIEKKLKTFIKKQIESVSASFKKKGKVKKETVIIEKEEEKKEEPEPELEQKSKEITDEEKEEILKEVDEEVEEVEEINEEEVEEDINDIFNTDELNEYTDKDEEEEGEKEENDFEQITKEIDEMSKMMENKDMFEVEGENIDDIFKDLN